jgi:hypothetical protein
MPTFVGAVDFLHKNHILTMSHGENAILQREGRHARGFLVDFGCASDGGKKLIGFDGTVRYVHFDISPLKIREMEAKERFKLFNDGAVVELACPEIWRKLKYGSISAFTTKPASRKRTRGSQQQSSHRGTGFATGIWISIEHHRYLDALPRSLVPRGVRGIRILGVKERIGSCNDYTFEP